MEKQMRHLQLWSNGGKYVWMYAHTHTYTHIHTHTHILTHTHTHTHNLQTLTKSCVFWQVMTQNLKVMLYIECVMPHLLFSFDTPCVQFSFFRCALQKIYDFVFSIIPVAQATRRSARQSCAQCLQQSTANSPALPPSCADEKKVAVTEP
jgi:hypothetical protein